jgi:hypothetical protein
VDYFARLRTLTVKGIIDSRMVMVLHLIPLYHRLHVILSRMPTDHIVALLIAERDRLNAAIEVLQGGTITKRRGRPPGSKNSVSATPATPKKQGRTFTAAQRKAQAVRMKKYWAAKKKPST